MSNVTALPQRRTVWQQNADTHATRDRIGAANLTLEVAVQQAVELIRKGAMHAARLVLVRAGYSAERMLGGRS